MAFNQQWDKTVPADTRSAGLGANDIRNFKEAVEERLEVDHIFGEDDNDGKHKSSTYKAQSVSPTIESDEAAFFSKTVSEGDPAADHTDIYVKTNDGEFRLTKEGQVNPNAIYPAGFSEGDILVADSDGKLVSLAKGTEGTSLVAGEDTVEYRTPKVLGSAIVNTVSASEFGNTGGIRDVAYGNGVFVAGGYAPSFTGTGGIVYSTNGVDWTECSVAAPTYIISGICFYFNKFFACSTNGEILTSSDGINWTLVIDTNDPLQGINVVNGKIYTVGTNSMWVSSSGAGFTEISVPSGQYFSTTYGKDKYVCVGTNALITSDDGVSWTSTAQTWNARNIAFGNEKFLVAETGGTSQLYESSDGLAWSVIPNPVKSPLLVGDYGNCCIFDNGMFTVGGSFGVAFSEDASSWKVFKALKHDYTETTIACGNGAYGGDRYVFPGYTEIGYLTYGDILYG